MLYHNQQATEVNITATSFTMIGWVVLFLLVEVTLSNSSSTPASTTLKRETTNIHNTPCLDPPPAPPGIARAYQASQWRSPQPFSAPIFSRASSAASDYRQSIDIWPIRTAFLQKFPEMTKLEYSSSVGAKHRLTAPIIPQGINTPQSAAKLFNRQRQQIQEAGVAITPLTGTSSEWNKVNASPISGEAWESKGDDASRGKWQKGEPQLENVSKMHKDEKRSGVSWFQYSTTVTAPEVPAAITTQGLQTSTAQAAAVGPQSSNKLDRPIQWSAASTDTLSGVGIGPAPDAKIAHSSAAQYDVAPQSFNKLDYLIQPSVASTVPIIRTAPDAYIPPRLNVAPNAYTAPQLYGEPQYLNNLGRPFQGAAVVTAPSSEAGSFATSSWNKMNPNTISGPAWDAHQSAVIAHEQNPNPINPGFHRVDLERAEVSDPIIPFQGAAVVTAPSSEAGSLAASSWNKVNPNTIAGPAWDAHQTAVITHEQNPNPINPGLRRVDLEQAEVSDPIIPFQGAAVVTTPSSEAGSFATSSWNKVNPNTIAGPALDAHQSAVIAHEQNPNLINPGFRRVDLERAEVSDPIIPFTGLPFPLTVPFKGNTLVTDTALIPINFLADPWARILKTLPSIQEDARRDSGLGKKNQTDYELTETCYKTGLGCKVPYLREINRDYLCLRLGITCGGVRQIPLITEREEQCLFEGRDCRELRIDPYGSLRKLDCEKLCKRTGICIHLIQE